MAALKVFQGAAFIREGLGWAAVDGGCACPQGGVSVMAVSSCCCGWSLLGGFGSPPRVRFWPAMVGGFGSSALRVFEVV